MYNNERKYIFAPILAGLGSGFGIRNNQVFQYVAIGGIIGVSIDYILKKVLPKN